MSFESKSQQNIGKQNLGSLFFQKDLAMSVPQLEDGLDSCQINSTIKVSNKKCTNYNSNIIIYSSVTENSDLIRYIKNI